MRKILKIFVLLKVIVALLKKRNNQKKQPVIKIKPQAQNPTPAKAPLNIGNFTDDILNANISVKDTSVIIRVNGFYNEFDAMVWAKLQSELWLKEKAIKNNNITLH